MDFRHTCLVGVVTAIVFVPNFGCSKRKTAKTTELEAIEKLGSLPGLKRTRDPELKAELARLTAERATPVLLQHGQFDGESAPRAETAEQVAEHLHKIIPAHEVRLALKRIERFYPRGAFRFDPVALRQALEFEQLFAHQRQQYMDLFGQSRFRFRVNLMRGLLADLSFIEHAKLAQRLQAIVAADSLAAGEPAEAVFPVRQTLAMLQKLARVPNLAARDSAARLRGDTLRIVQAIVLHPRCSTETAAALREMIAGQLAAWAPDRLTWIGDRALGLHTYEMVRDGRLLSLLTEEEIRAMKAKKTYNAFVQAVTKSVDSDERFYLSMMRQLVAACGKPYYQRTPLFTQLHQQLAELEDTPRYPLLAVRILLPGIEPGQRLQALDRARCEAWALALARALGAKTTADQVNPLTGKAFQIKRTETQIEITAIDPRDTELRVLVPRQFAPDAPRRSAADK